MDAAGGKLVGGGMAGNAFQGISVTLSADGNTAIVGGSGDNSSVGAVWVFTRSGGVWTQQGAKLVGAGAVGIVAEGNSVALSADGNRAIVGGSLDNGLVGAAWVFRRNRAGVWAQFGQKLVGVGAAGTAFQGASVALSGDGSTVMVSGPGDNGDAGAAWVFGRPAATEVTPNAGTVDGGTNVLILGSNLNDVVSVTFGGVPATDVFEVEPGAILATTPPHAVRRVNVIVTTTSGRSRAIGAFTYEGHATVTTLASSVHPSRLGQTVTFTATVRATDGIPASGNVMFRNCPQVLATVALSGGVATCTTNTLSVGFHQIRAFFVRNGAFYRFSDGVRQRVR